MAIPDTNIKNRTDNQKRVFKSQLFTEHKEISVKSSTPKESLHHRIALHRASRIPSERVDCARDLWVFNCFRD